MAVTLYQQNMIKVLIYSAQTRVNLVNNLPTCSPYQNQRILSSSSANFYSQILYTQTEYD